MRVLAISALSLLALAFAAAPAQAAGIDPPVNVEIVQCVTDPCPPQVTCDPSDGSIVDREHDCSHEASIDLIDCLWGERWVEYKVGPATVRYTECTSPYETQ